jgi:polar amino acid transport system substrate-binding protein
MNNKFVSYLASGFFFCCLVMPVQAETVLEKIQRTGVLNVAMREDAAPFGYLDSNGNLNGYCLDFVALLKRQLIQKLERQTLSVKLFKSTTNNRFSLVGNDLVDLECGSNTIRASVPENTNFSTAFFITGTQFLVSEKNRDRLKLDQDLTEIRLGVIKDTTTEKFISEAYPAATIERFSGITARNRGVQAVAQGKIDAMISDGILLRAEAQRQGLLTSEYPLIPETPLSCDRYGMIIGSNDPQWHDFVNAVIKSSETIALSQAWFGDLFDQNQVVANVCTSK